MLVFGKAVSGSLRDDSVILLGLIVSLTMVSLGCEMCLSK